MYESPITEIFEDAAIQMVKHDEEYLMMAVNQAMSYNVDKEELFKALHYDRNQYQKGYDDAKAEILTCKDCKWWDGDKDNIIGICHACKHSFASGSWDIGIFRKTRGNFYCANAEKEEVEDATV